MNTYIVVNVAASADSLSKDIKHFKSLHLVTFDPDTRKSSIAPRALVSSITLKKDH